MTNIFVIIDEKSFYFYFFILCMCLFMSEFDFVSPKESWID